MNRLRKTKERSFKKLLASHGMWRGALIPLLQKTQDIFGYIPELAVRGIARRLRLSEAQVYGVATFFGQFRLKPSGRHTITVCHGTACHVAGAEFISEALETALGIKTGETTADGRYTLRNVACLGCCSLAPVMMMDRTVHGRLTRTKIQSMFKKKK